MIEALSPQMELPVPYVIDHHGRGQGGAGRASISPRSRRVLALAGRDQKCWIKDHGPWSACRRPERPLIHDPSSRVRDRGRAGSCDLGFRLRIPHGSRHAERRRPRRSHPAIAPDETQQVASCWSQSRTPTGSEHVVFPSQEMGPAIQFRVTGSDCFVVARHDRQCLSAGARPGLELGVIELPVRRRFSSKLIEMDRSRCRCLLHWS